MPDVAIWNQCNSHCVMCTNASLFQSGGESPPYSFAHIKRRWANRRLEPGDVICLTGGEPTIHPEFFDIFHWFREEYPGYPIAIATNGRMLSLPSFSGRVLRMKNLILEVAVHGHNEASHDSVTRTPGSFAQTIAGIHNVLRLKTPTQELELRIIVSKLTYKNLDKILAFLFREFDMTGVRDIALIFLEMEGQARENIGLVGLSYKTAKPYISSAVKKWSAKLPEIRLFHFPLCTVPRALWESTWRTLRGEEVMFLPGCGKCKVKNYCLGVHKDYVSIIGTKEFHPLVRFRGKIYPGESFHKPIKNIGSL